MNCLSTVNCQLYTHPVTGFVYDPLFLEHDTGVHPENGNRMLATMALLQECGLLAKLARIRAGRVAREEAALVHDPAYVAAVPARPRAAAAGSIPTSLDHAALVRSSRCASSAARWPRSTR